LYCAWLSAGQARAVASKIVVVVSMERHERIEHSIAPEAYDAYLRRHYFWNQPGERPTCVRRSRCSTGWSARSPYRRLRARRSARPWVTAIARFEYLAKAREERYDFQVYLSSETAADSLHEDPRWDEIIPVPGTRNELYE
jgi:hypothetical protein